MNWDKKKIIFYIIVAVFVALVATGLRLWYGSVHEPNYIDQVQAVCQKHPGDTITLGEFIEGHKHSAFWLRYESVEVTVELDRASNVDASKVLKYMPESKSFLVCGFGKGRITVRSSTNKALWRSVPF